MTRRRERSATLPIMNHDKAPTLRRLDSPHGYVCATMGCPRPAAYVQTRYAPCTFFGLCEAHGWETLGTGDTGFSADLVVQWPLPGLRFHRFEGWSCVQSAAMRRGR